MPTTGRQRQENTTLLGNRSNVAGFTPSWITPDDSRRAQIEQMISDLEAAGLTGQAEQLRAALSTSYSPTFGQRIGYNWFGVTSGRDQFYNELYNNAIATGSNALEAYRQQQYNSEGSSVQRERSSGLNPDLAGITNSSAGQAGVDPEVTPAAPNPVVDNPLSEAASLVSSIATPFMDIGNILQSGIAIANSFVQFSGLRADVLNREISSLGSEYDTVLNILAGIYPSMSDEPDTSGTNPLDSVTVSGIARSLPLSRRARKLFKMMSGRVIYDENGNQTSALQQKIRELQRKSLSDAQESVGIMNSPGFHSDIMKWSEQFWEVHGKYQEKLLELSNQIAEAQSEYQKDYLDKAKELGTAEQQAKADFEQSLADLTSSVWNTTYYNSYDALMAAASGNAENQYSAEYKNASDGAADAASDRYQKKLAGITAQIESAMESYFSDQLSAIDGMSISADAKLTLKQGIYEQRAQYRNKIIEMKAQATARGSEQGRIQGNPFGHLPGAPGLNIVSP